MRTTEQTLTEQHERIEKLRAAIIQATGTSPTATDDDVIAALVDWSKTLEAYRHGEKPLEAAARRYILATNEGQDTTAPFVALVSEATKDFR
jgi:hypothetical protein